MARARLELHDIFIGILGTQGQPISRVYFQPPSTVTLKYPCIIYKRDSRSEAFANDNLYIGMKRYLATVIDSDPDSPIPDKVGKLPYCAFTRHYSADSLNHDVYTIYF